MAGLLIALVLFADPTLALQDPKGWTEYVNAWSTLVIAIFTVLLVAAVIWQTKTTRSLERAWITAHLDWFEKSNLRVVSHTSVEQGTQTESIVVNLRLICKNRGRSLARIDEIMGRLDIASEAIRERPAEVSLSNFGEMDAIQADSESARGIQLHCMGRPAEDLYVFVYVLIKYRDIFGRHRETSLGYAIDDSSNLYRQDAVQERNTNT